MTQHESSYDWTDRPELSIIVPLYNEEDSLVDLHRQLTETLRRLDRKYEIIFVDDGSTDNSLDVVERLHDSDKRVEIISFRRNFGKAAGLQAGVNHSRGEILITMDADLQDVPAEIPKFLDRLDEGVDVVSGWKRKRNDPIGKTIPSKFFNHVTGLVSGISIHDFNCGFKAYRREVFDHVGLYGELHRYVPVLAGWQGFSVGEVVVEHRARQHGRSKYGVGRFLKGMLDLVSIYFTRRHAQSPLHLFGIMGAFSILLGSVSLVYLAGVWAAGTNPIGDRPLLLFGILTFLFGGQLLSFGIIAEMLAKSDSRQEAPFVIRQKHSHRVFGEESES
jgi:glycosyltransferase involved in cell wall biosynthesis